LAEDGGGNKERNLHQRSREMMPTCTGGRVRLLKLPENITDIP